MARVLGVGIATLDVVNVVENYPDENSEHRALDQHIHRGGNATNTLVVLSQLAHRCYWCGTRGDDLNGNLILNDLDDHGVDYTHSYLVAGGKTPTSYVSLSGHTGSRSIVHYRDLPEMDFAHFQHLTLNLYDWIHFEGRNVEQVGKMMAYVKELYPQIPTSLEVEKTRPGIESLFNLADYLLFSKAYVTQQGCTSAEQWLHEMQDRFPGRQLVCAWGEDGAYAMDHHRIVHSPAFPPEKVVDTLGAGDTFNAGFIHAQLQQQTVSESLRFACQLAGKKCGQMGLENLA